MQHSCFTCWVECNFLTTHNAAFLTPLASVRGIYESHEARPTSTKAKANFSILLYRKLHRNKALEKKSPREFISFLTLSEAVNLNQFKYPPGSIYRV